MKEFTNDNYKPTVFWAWNGDMRDDEIRADIDAFAAAGIGGVHLHARAGLTLSYLGDEWWRAYRTAVAACKEKGIDVWIYDEQGWPSGFAGGQVCALGEAYRQKHLCVLGDTLATNERFLAAYRKTADGYARTKDAASADLKIGCRITEQYTDLLNPRVAEAFIAVTHEVYRKHFADEFGKTIKGVFTDEPQLHVSSLVWSDEIPAAYRAAYGEDVYDELYRLFEEEGESYQTFRYRYYAVVRTLFVQNYTRKLSKWCDENGLILTGHFAGEEGLCLQVASNTGVMPHYEWMHQPGIDHLGRRLNPLLLLKQIQSVQNQFGRRRILSETFACTGNGVNFRELAWIWSYQAAFGVNMPCMSIAMPYLGGIRKRDYPVFFSPQQPWWPRLKDFNAFMTNSARFVSQGKATADVLLLSGVNSALQEPLFSLKQRSMSARYRRLAEDLVSLQIPYDIGDEQLLCAHGGADNGELTLGEGKYRIVILPELDTISLSTVRLLQKFAAGGGQIVCMTALPARIDGEIDHPAQAELAVLPVRLIQQRRGILEKYFASIHYPRKMCLRDYFGKLTNNMILTFRETDTGYSAVLLNTATDAERSITLCARGNGRFYKYDCGTGKETQLPSFAAGSESCAPCTVSRQDAWYIRFERTEAPVLYEDPPAKQTVRETPFTVLPLGENVLTLDYAAYAVGDDAFGEKTPTVEIHDAVLREATARGGVRVAVRYAFTCACAGHAIALAAETRSVRRITVNGKSLDAPPQGCYRDRDFLRYDITPFVQNGENTVEFAYEIPAAQDVCGLNEVHDCMRNKVTYPVEVESVYLVGDFDVAAQGSVAQKPHCITADGNFVITAPNVRRTGGSITEQGRWFYAGNATYRAKIARKPGRMWLKPEYDGTCAEIFVNGKSAGTAFLSEQAAEITEYLHEGENEVEITVYGNLRNMLGPHHHYNGEVEYTGVHTFTGEYGNGAVEDLSSAEQPENVWSDTYSFVRLGLNKLYEIHKKSDTEVKK